MVATRKIVTQIPEYSGPDPLLQKMFQGIREKLTNLNASIESVTTSAGGVGATGQTGAAGADGAQGLPGIAGDSITSIAAQNLLQGQPVYADPITGQFKLADATTLAKATVVGMCANDALTGFSSDANQLNISLVDWTNVIGSMLLTQGQIYYLSTTPGMLTTTAPTTVGQCVTRVGVAITTQLFEIFLQAPILL